MMKRFVFIALAIACVSRAFGIGASQEWVKNYIAQLNGGTNAVITVEAGTNTFTGTYHVYSHAALMATNSVHATITNGYLFAYTTNGIYKGGAQTIQATTSNLVWNSSASVFTNGVDRFVGAFDIVGRKITEAKAKEVAE